MKTVREILGQKGNTVWRVTPETLVYDALRLMAEKEVGALLVQEEGGGLAGILSERDYARKVILKGRSSLKTPVREIMTHTVVCVRPEQSVDECMALMTTKRVRHLPVLVGREVVGIVSIGDLVKASLDEKDFLIQQLESYITGG
jgi:CBS domain-containing protein